MGTIASQITSITIVYSIVYSDADKRKHQSSASLSFVRGIHRGPVNSPHKWPVTRKVFPFDDVIINLGERSLLWLKYVTYVVQTLCCIFTFGVDWHFSDDTFIMIYHILGVEWHLFYVGGSPYSREARGLGFNVPHGSVPWLRFIWINFEFGRNCRFEETVAVWPVSCFGWKPPLFIPSHLTSGLPAEGNPVLCPLPCLCGMVSSQGE